MNDENTNKKADIDVILTSYVEGLGQPGDQVSVRPYSGYEKVIVPGLAVYATPENIAKYAPLRDASQAVQHSSKYSLKVLFKFPSLCQEYLFFLIDTEITTSLDSRCCFK